MRKIVITIAFLFFAYSAAAEYKYSFLVGRPSSTSALGINDSGAVIINYFINGSSSCFCFIYREGSYLMLLPPVSPKCYASLAYAINNRGDVVFRGAFKEDYDYYSKWFLYREGSYTELIENFIITDINDSGVMVGWDESSPDQQKGLQYDGITYKEIAPPGWLNPGASAFPLNRLHINNNGTIIAYGYYNNMGSTSPAFLYNNGDYTELLPPGWLKVGSVAINNHDVVALGGCDSSGNQSRVSVYNRGIYTELPLPPGVRSAEIIDINDRGEFIVNGCIGYNNLIVEGACDTHTGYVYHDGGYTELLPPGWGDYSMVSGINNNGDVVGDRGFGTVFIAGPDKIDSDGDAVADDSDVCSDSAINSTIAMGMCNTGVPNQVYDDGCTMQDQIRECARNSNRLTFFRCVTNLTKDWRKHGEVRWNEKVRIQICAAIGSGPTSTTTIETTPTTTTTIAATGDRFKDNGDGTVTDTRTSLIWLENANPFGTKTWDSAVASCSSLASGTAGLTDGSKAGQWRLPSREELEGIGTDPPATWDSGTPTVPWTMPGAPFINVQTDYYYYWSGSDVALPDEYMVAWFVSMHYGIVLPDNKELQYYVWPVRDGN